MKQDCILPYVVLALLLCAGATSTAFAAPPAGTSWAQTFGDEFNTLDYSKWNTRYVWGPNTTINNELQYYVDLRNDGTTKSGGNNPFGISNGVLSISADRAPGECCNGLAYTSGALTTYDIFSQTYGYFEIRARMPSGQGLWAAFWMHPADNSWPPELDIVEMVGQRPTESINTAHTNITGAHTFEQCWPYYVTPDMSLHFHTYGLLWTPTDLMFYFDGNVSCALKTKADQHKPFYLLINLAIGPPGFWTGSPDDLTTFPQTLEVIMCGHISPLKAGC